MGRDDGFVVLRLKSHAKEFGFYSKCNENIVTRGKQERCVIQVTLLWICGSYWVRVP